jgi:hypothetical protein
MGKWIACVLLAACGAEYMPAAAGTFERRVEWEQVLVLDDNNPDVRFYGKIGAVIARARKATHAIDACRKEAADHGGDAIVANHIRGGEWECKVLRRLPPPPIAVAPPPQAPPRMAEPAAPPIVDPPPPRKKRRRPPPQ